ncbi:hypothetical protein cyc_01848 [Cyclospora cayetanensis]|uniref:PH domain-containing protein n=1 Tax=Cyclospora cayetanensis TaxID=88456 RepID=A0A1D3CUI2_9EIME|nr:hypothetical protein cyc_01848 [Cyclospora cayetanensis]
MSSSSPGGETAASHPDAATVREENCGAQGSGGGEAGTVWEFQTADPAVRTLSSSSAFLATADAKDGDAEEAINLLRNDCGVRRGNRKSPLSSLQLHNAPQYASTLFLRRLDAGYPFGSPRESDKAFPADSWLALPVLSAVLSQDASSWKDATIPSGSRWTCIPLSTCVQVRGVVPSARVMMPNELELMRSPQDGKVFLVQTASRSYYWRAQSQSEAEAWLLSIGTQCAALKELELLQQAEERLIQTEEAHTDSCVSSLPFANRQSLSPRYPGSVLRTMVTDVRTIMQNILEFLHSLYRLEGTLRFSDTRELFEGYLVDFFRSAGSAPGPHNMAERRQPWFSLHEVQSFIRTWTARQHDEAKQLQAGGGDAGASPMTESEKRIGNWLRICVFPHFTSSPIIQRRIAQLAASHGVQSWGIDPLKSPLIVANMFRDG